MGSSYLIAHAKAPKRYPPALIQLLLRGCLIRGLDQLDKQHRVTIYYSYEKLQCESITTTYSYKLLRQYRHLSFRVKSSSRKNFQRHLLALVQRKWSER